MDNEAKRRRQAHQLAIERVDELTAGPGSGATRTESSEVIANEEEAAIGFSGKFSRNDLLPLAGAVTRIAEGGDGCGAAAVEGVTLRGAGFLDAPLIGPTALGECAGLGLVGGGVFRAISPVEPLRSGLASGLADGLDSIAGDEFETVESTFANDSESRVLSLDFSSEGVASSSLLAPEEYRNQCWIGSLLLKMVRSVSRG